MLERERGKGAKIRRKACQLYNRTNSDYFPMQQKLAYFYNRELTLYNSVGTICTSNFYIQQFYILPAQLCLSI